MFSIIICFDLLYAFKCALTTTRPRFHTHPHQSGAGPFMFFWARITPLQKNRGEIRSRIPNRHMSKPQWSAPDSETSYTFANPRHKNASTALVALRICKSMSLYCKSTSQCAQRSHPLLCASWPHAANAVGIDSQRQ